ncbi:12385_t:CDS:10 [Funneliformis caledonium]|uniref:12385_t:CDS:1 n=1 Tax=Funneliformis caledonium TaxID=1117310 RepID=A0A9N8VEG5_9GLOM|nr:12385_t:CDS:10 [Funneliformis caledonium]
MVMAFNVFIAGIKSSQICEKTRGKETRTQEELEIENIIEEEKPENFVEDIYGLLLNVTNAHRPRKEQVKRTYNRPIAFGCFCFAPASQKSGKGFQSGFYDGFSILEEAMNGTLMMAAADQNGCIMVFDFGANKFWQVSRLGIAASAIAFTHLVRNELVVAFTDNSIRCYNVGTRQLIAEARSHRSPVNWISMHPKQHAVITSAKSEAILWNMVDWSKQKVLNHIKDDVALTRAVFSAQGEYIITSFFDDSIYIWSNSSFDLLWKLQVPTRVSDLLIFSDAYDNTCRIAATSKNGKLILVAGKTNVFVWEFDTKNLIRDINLKSIIEGEIMKLELIHDDSIKYFEISPDGKFIVTNSMEERAILKIWDLEVLISDTLQHKYRDFSTLRSISPPTEIRMSLSSNVMLSSQVTSEDDEEVSDIAYGQELKATNGLIASTGVSSENSISIQEADLTSRRTSITSMESRNLSGLSSDSREKKRGRLVEKLHHLGRYPDKHRVRVWSILLDLPQNRQAYKEVTSKGVDPAIKASLSNNLKSSDSKRRRIIGKLERLRAIPTFVRLGYDQRVVVEWIFHMVYPFAELLSDTYETLSFELILSILFNWYQYRWDEFPNPPTNIMNAINVLLAHWDNDLHTHLMSCNIKIQDCVWTMILWSFTKILTREDWLELWDHLLSNDEPSFMCFFIISYIMVARDILLEMNQSNQILDFFTRTNTINISRILEISYKLEKETPLEISPRFEISRYKPLIKSGKEYKLDYITSLKYYRTQYDDIRDWIWEQEKEIIKKRYF